MIDGDMFCFNGRAALLPRSWYNCNVSSVDDVLTILFSYSAGYKRLRQLARGGSTFPQIGRFSSLDEKKSDSSLRSTLCRLRKNGLAKKQGGVWFITPKGADVHKKRQVVRKRAEFMKLNRKKKKTMIVAFDVPEHKRGLRDWLREELLFLGFEPIQKSVWFGPGPLLEKFVRELDARELLPCIKFFRAMEDELV